MKTWRELPVISAPMPYQMALDEVLFRGMESAENPAAPVFRFFFSSEPWVTTGYFEDFKDFPKSGNVCRRLTGGGRVEHGQDLIFSIVAAKEHDESFGSVKDSYHKIHQAVKRALENLGHKIHFYTEASDRPGGPECFVYPIESDLGMDRKKVAGGAQKRSSGVLLHEESVQLRDGMDAWQLMDALRVSLQEIFEVTIVTENLNPEQTALARKLSKDGYEPGNYRAAALAGEKA